VAAGAASRVVALDAALLDDPLLRWDEKLLQNSSDTSRPIAPAIIRMIPTVLMLKPSVVTLTAKVRIAPTTSRKMLAPMLMSFPSARMSRSLDRATRHGGKENNQAQRDP
jgi:hypothetical protein